MKNKYWQEVRGYMIILVVIIHSLYITKSNDINCFNIVVRNIANIAVPCFLFMAGYFSPTIIDKEYYKKKVRRLIIPLIIWNIIYTIFGYLGNESINIKSLIIDLILSRKAGHLYYVYVLIQLFMLLPILNKIVKTRFKYIPLIITFLSNVAYFIVINKLSIEIPIYKFLVLGWVSYFYLGIILRGREKEIRKKQINILSIITLGISIGYNLCLYINKQIPYDLAVSQFAITNYLYSIITLVLIYNYSKKKKNNNSIITKMGDYSYGIYLIHLLIILLIKDRVIEYNINYFASVTAIFLITIIISIILCHAFKKLKKEVITNE